VAKKLHIRSSLTALLKLIRVSNLVILALTQYFIAVFLIGPRGKWQEIIFDPRLFLVILSTAMIAAAGYIINDYYDIKIDIINKPKRVIIGKILKRRVAIFTHTLFNTLGILIGLSVSWKIALINFAAAFLLWLYSNSLKRLPLIGNLVVSFLTSLSIVIVAVYFGKNYNLVLIFAIFAFFISLVREIIKDMEDVKGDAAFGCKTLPLVYGIRKTKFLIYTLIIAFLIILLLLGKELSEYMIWYFLLFIFLPVAFLIFKLHKSDTSKDFRFLSIWCKLIMISGVISMTLV
jgi:4-hydroxybenzoate polyprenyltransferase